VPVLKVDEMRIGRSMTRVGIPVVPRYITNRYENRTGYNEAIAAVT
jgi:hypothetical protein